MRMIDADALEPFYESGTDPNDTYADMTYIRAEHIENAPTIEPEVRHGRWKGWTTSKFTGKYEDYDEPVYKDYVYYTCSECYRKSAIQELYCPACGARMDGGADNG